MIGPEEKEIIGNWVEKNSQVVEDAACERVKTLTEHYLVRLGVGEESGGWETLFRDPDDGRFWMRTYPHSEWHGGGPPALIQLSLEEARIKFPNLKLSGK
jgi:hypothetical protein